MSDIPVPASVALACSHCGCPLKGGETVCHACGWPLDGPAEADAIGPLPDMADEAGQAVPGDEVVVLSDVVAPRDEVAQWQGAFLKALALTFLLVAVLALGSMGLGYALFVKLGQGRQTGIRDQGDVVVPPAAPVALAPTGDGPMRLTELPPSALQPAPSPAAGAAVAPTPDSATQDDTDTPEDTTSAADTAEPDVDTLLASARSCLANDDLDCAVANARAVLKQDRQNRAARKIMSEVRAVTTPARLVAVPDAGTPGLQDRSGGQAAGDAPEQNTSPTPAASARQP